MATLLLIAPRALAGSPAIGQSPVLATSFHELCGGCPCTIVLDQRGIGRPAGFISAGANQPLGLPGAGEIPRAWGRGWVSAP